ncbi:MAG: glycosyltransferase [Bacteroidetes bacterium]|nr:glycosyltransferase [Bacteroidota bacterium]
MPRSLHIVSFDVPFPPDYGGVIDVYYKIKSLKEAGVNVHLHAYAYGRVHSEKLDELCASVNYYDRNMSSALFFSRDPFIIASRRSDELLQKISSNDLPVFFEGLHTCTFLGAPELSAKKKFVRTHNIEHDYYRSLAAVEKKFSRRFYFNSEAKKLERFEKKLSLANGIFAISPADAEQLSSRYKNVEHVMAFHPNEKVEIKSGSGNFALYHGNLEVGENDLAARFLVNEVFSFLPFELIIAGNNPTAQLKKAVSGKKNIRLLANISTAEIDALISEAQVNVLPTFQATGIKLKLLAALFRGRHCLVNSPMIANTGLEKICVIGETALAMRARLNELFAKNFDADEILLRKNILGENFSNKKNAEKLIAKIF